MSAAAITRAETDVDWIKGDSEWPADRDMYPCHVNPFRYHTGYFELKEDMVRAVLPAMKHGWITMADVENAERSWRASYMVMNPADWMPGVFSGKRFFRFLSKMEMEPGDVVYFMKDDGDDPQRVRVGIWKQGSELAEAFIAAAIAG